MNCDRIFSERQLDSLISLIDSVKDDVSRKEPEIKSTVDYIINKKMDSPELIEFCLDSLLSYAVLGVGVDEFYRLNTYYSTINDDNSKDYSKLFEDLISKN